LKNDYGNQEDYTELNCAECGDCIGYCIEDNSLQTHLCTDCMDKLFPEEPLSEDVV